MFETNQENTFARFQQYAARRQAEQRLRPALQRHSAEQLAHLKTLLRSLMQRPVHMSAQFYLGSATSMD